MNFDTCGVSIVVSSYKTVGTVVVLRARIPGAIVLHGFRDSYPSPPVSRFVFTRILFPQRLSVP